MFFRPLCDIANYADVDTSSHPFFLLTPHFFLGLPLSKEYCREESFQVDREDHSVGTTKACVETSFFLPKNEKCKISEID